MGTVTTTRCDTLIKGIVVTMDPQRHVYERGAVAIRDGRIIAAGADDGSASFEADEVLEGELLVLPGLVNSHSHLVQGCIRGMAEKTTFEERLFGFYYPMTGACDHDRSYWSALPPLVDLAVSGVTTTADDHFTHAHKDSIDGVIDAVRAVGMRCRMARLILNDPNTVPDGFREQVEDGLSETERLRKSYGGETMRITASSIGISYVDPGGFREIFDWTLANGGQFDVHAPAFMDQKYLAERRGWDGGSFEWLDSEGMLGPNVLAAHAQNLRAGEHRLIADRGAAVTIIPDMESILGWLHFDSRQFLSDNATVGLGLDGPVVAYAHNLWLAMRSLVTAQRMHDTLEILTRPHSKSLVTETDRLLFGGAELALELATIGSARAIGWGDEIGSLEAGKAADVLVIDLSRETTLSPPASLIANLVYAGGPRPDAVRAVLVNGKPIVENGEPVGVERAEVVRRANAVQRELIAETNAERFVHIRSDWNWIP